MTLHYRDAILSSFIYLFISAVSFVSYRSDWPSDFGGFTSYVANEEDEELLTVSPEDNCLALVYRDKETLKFVKHINHKSSCQENGNYLRRTFYDFSFVYYE